MSLNGDLGRVSTSNFQERLEESIGAVFKECELSDLAERLKTFASKTRKLWRPAED